MALAAAGALPVGVGTLVRHPCLYHTLDIHPSVIFPSADPPPCPYLAKDKPVNLETPGKVRHHGISLVHLSAQKVETTEVD